MLVDINLTLLSPFFVGLVVFSVMRTSNAAMWKRLVRKGEKISDVDPEILVLNGHKEYSEYNYLPFIFRYHFFALIYLL